MILKRGDRKAKDVIIFCLKEERFMETIFCEYHQKILKTDDSDSFSPALRKGFS